MTSVHRLRDLPRAALDALVAAYPHKPYRQYPRLLAARAAGHPARGGGGGTRRRRRVQPRDRRRHAAGSGHRPAARLGHRLLRPPDGAPRLRPEHGRGHRGRPARVVAAACESARAGRPAAPDGAVSMSAISRRWPRSRTPASARWTRSPPTSCGPARIRRVTCAGRTRAARNAADHDAVLEITREAYQGYRGRFHLDAHIPADRADGFYEEWARQCLAGVDGRPHHGVGGLDGPRHRLPRAPAPPAGLEHRHADLGGGLGACRRDARAPTPASSATRRDVGARAQGAVAECQTQNANFPVIRVYESVGLPLRAGRGTPSTPGWGDQPEGCARISTVVAATGQRAGHWAASSAGRAPRSQRGGQEFDPPAVHHSLPVPLTGLPSHPPAQFRPGRILSRDPAHRPSAAPLGLLGLALTRVLPPALRRRPPPRRPRVGAPAADELAAPGPGPLRHASTTSKVSSPRPTRAACCARRPRSAAPSSSSGRAACAGSTPSPERKEFVSNGAKIYAYLPADRQVIVSPAPDAAPTTTPALFLTGQANLARDFDASSMTVPGAAPGLLGLKLVARKPDPDFEWLAIGVDPMTFQIQHLVALDRQGGRSTFTFTNLKENRRPSDNTLRVPHSKGVDVVTNDPRTVHPPSPRAGPLACWLSSSWRSRACAIGRRQPAPARIAEQQQDYDLRRRRIHQGRPRRPDDRTHPPGARPRQAARLAGPLRRARRLAATGKHEEALVEYQLAVGAESRQRRRSRTSCARCAPSCARRSPIDARRQDHARGAHRGQPRGAAAGRRPARPTSTLPDSLVFRDASARDIFTAIGKFAEPQRRVRSRRSAISRCQHRPAQGAARRGARRRWRTARATSGASRRRAPSPSSPTPRPSAASTRKRSSARST